MQRWIARCRLIALLRSAFDRTALEVTTTGNECEDGCSVHADIYNRVQYAFETACMRSIAETRMIFFAIESTGFSRQLNSHELTITSKQVVF